MTDIDEKLGALYHAARAQEAPTHADRAAVRTALASALIVSAGAASAHATAGVAATQTVKALTVGKIAGWLLVGAALGGVTSSAAWVLTSPPGSSPDNAVSASRPAPHEAAARSSSDARALSARAPASEPMPEPAPEGAVRPSSSGGATPATGHNHAASTEASALMPPSLAAEGEGLLAIQRALASGDGPRALKMLGEQDAQFYGGALSEERAAVRVLAWCAAGRPEQAHAARARFFATYPHSPHAKRIQNSCAK
jgi:hypothetical protein